MPPVINIAARNKCKHGTSFIKNCYSPANNYYRVCLEHAKNVLRSTMGFILFVAK